MLRELFENYIAGRIFLVLEFIVLVYRIRSVPVCMFDKVFASFSLLTLENSHQKKCMSIDTHNLEVDMYWDL